MVMNTLVSAFMLFEKILIVIMPFELCKCLSNKSKYISKMANPVCR